MNKKLESIAYHEAGHAAANLYFRIKFKNVSIIPENISAGRVNPVKASQRLKNNIELGSLSPRDERYLKNECITTMAGPVAQAKFEKRKKVLNRGSKSDEYHFFEYTENLKIPQNGSLHYMNYIIEEAKDLFIDKNELFPNLWKFVIFLSKELIRDKELSYLQCKRHYQQIIGDNYYDSFNSLNYNINKPSQEWLNQKKLQNINEAIKLSSVKE
ncbi:MAG: hypothetical protein KGL19_16355 [Bacteroidota bacterium]|nr:hypothetical protein [Bacteroidota bacterium]